MGVTTSRSPLHSVLHRLKVNTGPIWTLMVFTLAGLIWLSICRVGLLLWQSERVSSAEDVWHILLSGVRVDFSSMCYLLLIPLLISLGLFVSNKSNSVIKRALWLYSVAAACLIVYLEVITPTFISEYDLRPNRLLIEYLVYPKEVFAMLWNGYKLEIALSSFALIAAAWFSSRLFNKHWQGQSQLTLPSRIGVTLLVVVVTFMGARSSLGHRPLNPALVAFSNDHLLNDLALNSSYSAIFALKQMGLENSSAKYYGAMPDEAVIEIVRTASNKPESAYEDPQIPTKAMNTASHQGKRKNVVILLQESLGARYVGGLGGLPLTPNLDKAMQQGWNFTNLYATGTRSVRGIEAVITGFTPTPSRSVVKLDKSQRDFFTIADLLKQNGYHTQFVYGGESHFDNMKSFFLGNGFSEIVDIDDFAKVDFEGSWGASDEDLYDQAHLEFEQLHKAEQPFFSLVFTSSNHTPYEYPDGKIIHYDVEKQTRNNAAKYSDYALGQFLEKAQKSEYWDDTLFLIVADHDSRVAGASLVPVERFRIPGVILGAGITPKQDARLVSHIDLAPTLLSLAGVSDYTPMLGHDLTKPVAKEKLRALMQYDKNFAYMTEQEITVLQPEKAPRAFNIVQGEWFERKPTQAQIDRAKAHVLFGSLAYNKGWYK